MSDQTWLNGTLAVLKEAVEGGTPGQGTAFLDGTKADGSGNHGLLATLGRLSAAQASDLTVLELSVAAHAAHMAYHMEVVARWESGERITAEVLHGFVNERSRFHPRQGRSQSASRYATRSSKVCVSSARNGSCER